MDEPRDWLVIFAVAVQVNIQTKGQQARMVRFHSVHLLLNSHQYFEKHRLIGFGVNLKFLAI